MYQQNIKRLQKMIEFKELRGGKDMAYYLRRSVKFGEWGGFSSKHLYNRNVIDNSFITTYDYDIKICFISILFIVIVFLKNILRK